MLLVHISGQKMVNHASECGIFATLQVKDFDWSENCLDLMAVLPIRVLALRVHLKSCLNKNFNFFSLF